MKGTFFEVGKAIDAEPQITRALYEHGQLLGNHSYHHDQWRWLDPRYPELERTQQAFRRAIGTCPAYYRPPHGDRTPFIAHVVSDHHMRIVMWNVSAGDWADEERAHDRPRIVQRREAGRDHPAARRARRHPDRRPDRAGAGAARSSSTACARSTSTPVGLDQLIGGPAYISC